MYLWIICSYGNSIFYLIPMQTSVKTIGTKLWVYCVGYISFSGISKIAFSFDFAFISFFVFTFYFFGALCTFFWSTLLLFYALSIFFLISVFSVRLQVSLVFKILCFFFFFLGIQYFWFHFLTLLNINLISIKCL